MLAMRQDAGCDIALLRADGGASVSDVMLQLWEVFKREGIRVPYPVREIRIRDGALPVEAMSDGPLRGARKA